MKYCKNLYCIIVLVVYLSQKLKLPSTLKPLALKVAIYLDHIFIVIQARVLSDFFWLLLICIR